MLELRLHGSLGRDFGKVWNLEVSTVREAINAICAMKPRFRQAVLALDRAGLVFKVRTKQEDLGEEHLHLNLPDTRVDVIPIMRGASAAGRIIAGVVLVVVAVVYGYYTQDWSTATHIGMMGLGLILGGVAQLLTNHPKRQDFKDDIKSWTINGPLNTTDQGNPVPVVYGEVLTGGVPISAGLTTTRGVPADTVTASATLGGDFDDVIRLGGPVSGGKVVLHFSISAINIQQILTYAWTVTGLTSSSSFVISGQGTATITVTITYTIPTETFTVDNFNVSCTVTGYSTTSYNYSSGSPNMTGTSASSAGAVTLDTRSVDWS